MRVKSSVVLNLAKSQIGYKEGKNNWTKYGRDYGWNNVAWCCIFIWWLFHESGADDMFGTKTASCTALWNQHKAQAVSKNNLKAGDIVFFDFSGGSECNHVGIVENAGSSQVTTIEGNTSSGNSGSQSNGDGVYRRYRKRSVISHAYRPNYVEEEKTVTITLTMLKNGSKGNQVKNLQILLNAKGYSCGTADGDFGAKTEKAVRAFQTANGLVSDGIVGKDTYNKLLK